MTQTSNPLHMNDNQLKQYIDQVFLKYDKQRDGTLKSLQMANYLTDLFQTLGYGNVSITPQQARQAIKMMDKNNDNKITKMELFLTFKQLANTQTSEFGGLKIFFMGQGGFNSDNQSPGMNYWDTTNNTNTNGKGSWGVDPYANPWTNSNTATQNTVTKNTTNTNNVNTWGTPQNNNNAWGASNNTNNNANYNPWGATNTNTNNPWGTSPTNTNTNSNNNNPWGASNTNTNNANTCGSPNINNPNTNNVPNKAWGANNTNTWGAPSPNTANNSWENPNQNSWQNTNNNFNQNSWGQQPANQAFKGNQQNAWGPQPNQQPQTWNQQNRGSNAQQQNFQQQARGSGTQMQPPVYVGGQQGNYNQYNQGQYPQQGQFSNNVGWGNQFGWGYQGHRPGTPPSAAYMGNIGMMAPVFYDPYTGYRVGSQNKQDQPITK